MGANAQTTVPKYTALTVLPAASMNISAGTGIPVFATTVTRDAAFGGANKVLAEGQLAYIEASDTVQYYSGALWVSVGEASKVVQMVNTQTGEVATGTTTTPLDDTIPQNSEGDQYMSLAITPNNASNILVIEVVWFGASSASTFNTVALFVGTTADALAAVSQVGTGSNTSIALPLTHKLVAGVTTELTFKVRVGPNSAATITFNGREGARLFGGVASSSITITEYTP